MAAREILSLLRAEFFIFSRVALVSCIVISSKVICDICVLSSIKLIEMSFAIDLV